MTGQDGADPGTGRARPSAPDFPKEASQSSLLGWTWGRTEHWGLSRPGAGMGVGEDQTEHRRFQVPGSLRPPPFLKDLAIAKPLPLPLLWLPPRPGCGSLLQGVRGEDKQTLSALPSKSSLSLYFLPFSCLYLVQSHHYSPGPVLSFPSMPPALSVPPQSQRVPESIQVRPHAPSFGGKSPSPPHHSKGPAGPPPPARPTHSAHATGAPCSSNTSVRGPLHVLCPLPGPYHLQI